MLESLLIKFQGFRLVNLLKRDSETGVCFPVNLVKFLRTPILENICELLLLHIKYCTPSTTLQNPSPNIAKQQEEEIQFESKSFKSKLTLHLLIIFTFAYIKDCEITPFSNLLFSLIMYV